METVLIGTAGGVPLSGEIPHNRWAERLYESCGRGSDSHHPRAMAEKKKKDNAI